ncbi:NUDIX hydrolase [Lysinibacillus macroides]|uniref:NUDIX hydrolase n=1 Tax=Lysinibacillus macroides TaxID=33935 RepID=A0A0M9DJV6_9BACI|nr:NUDIX hydrolase [Lysinibacillus macroides]KOY82103.1 NUDIX hydrolase [Lysinibacillus macroides]QPR68318.1 NUDIX hydrolase [Lysinibacillus macroides]
MRKDRGKIWLGVSGVTVNQLGQWLVVKKAYSGLKGRWSLPAGFVQAGETVDEAVIREIKEETGIDCKVSGLIGFRTGVIRDEISDNMAIFYCQMQDEQQQICIQENEILEAKWLYPQELAQDEMTSVMLKEMASNQFERHQLEVIEGINPGDIFGYTSYRLFFKK